MLLNIIFYYHSHTSPEATLFIFIIAIVAIFIGVFFSRRAIVLRKLDKKEVKKIKDFSDNDSGKIIGKVVFAGEIISAPLSKRKCVYYHVIVEQYHHSNRGGGRWSTLFEEESSGDVVMTDGSGFAIIDTNDDMDYLVPDVSYTSGTLNNPNEEMENLLKRNNYSCTDFFGLNKKLRYKEGVLEKGEKFTVLGVGLWNETKDHKITIPSAKVLVIVPSKNERVYLSDDPEAFSNENSAS